MLQRLIIQFTLYYLSSDRLRGVKIKAEEHFKLNLFKWSCSLTVALGPKLILI